jgi:hypothetical protein
MRWTRVNLWFFATAIILIAGSSSAQKENVVSRNSAVDSLEANFAESQLNLIDIWHFEGHGKANIENGRLALQDTGKGVVLWARQDFPSDVRLQFDLSFSNNRCIGVFFVAARGIEGQDILKDLPERTGKYGQYTKGKINCYGFSLHRFYPDGRHNPGTNLRKNSGSHLANHVKPDPVMKANEIYQVRIEKVGGHLRLWVDGNLIHDWEDDGTKGDILNGGKIGFRVRGDPSCIMLMDNIFINPL